MADASNNEDVAFEEMELEGEDTPEEPNEELLAEIGGILDPGGPDAQRAAGASPDEILDGSDEEAADDESEDEEEVDEEEEEEEDSEEVKELAGDKEKPAEKPQKESRAQKRIRELVSRVKAAEENAAEVARRQEAQLQQVYQSVQQQSQQYTEKLEQQLDLQNKQLEFLRGNRQAEEEAQLPYAERLKLEAQRAAVADSEAKINAVRQEFQQRFDYLDQQRAREQQEFARKQRLEEHTKHVEEAMTQLNVDKEIMEEHGALFTDGILSLMAASNMGAADAVKLFNNMFDLSHRSRLLGSKAKGSKAKKPVQKMKKNRNIPGPTGPGRKRGSEPRPSTADILAAGWEDTIEWREAGSPPVPKNK